MSSISRTKRGPYKLHESDNESPIPRSSCRKECRGNSTVENGEHNNESESESDGEAIYESLETDTLLQDDEDSSSEFVCHDQDTHDTNKKYSEMDGEPIYTGARISVSESMLLIISFAMRSGMAGQDLSNLLCLIELHCLPENMFKSTKQLFKHFFKKIKEPIQLKYFCETCGYYGGTIQTCGICNEGNMKYFVNIPVATQLTRIISRIGIGNIQASKRDRASCNPTNALNDVYDGNLYKEQFTRDGFYVGTEHSAKEKEIHLSLQLNTDGVALFHSSKFSIWPLYAAVNEIPAKQRFTRENRIFAGLWFGKTKPNMQVFLKSFADEMNALFHEGITTIEGYKIRGMVLSSVADAPARCMMLNTLQFNGKYGCPVCLSPGESCKVSEKGQSHVYPYDMTEENKMQGHSEIRTATDTLRIASEVESENILKNKDAPKFGIKGYSVMSCFPKYDIIRRTSIDYMHCVLLGIMKMLLGLWFNAKHASCQWSIRKKFKSASERLLAISPPNFISRIPRSFDDIAHWKASEFKSFLLYFGVPVLTGILGKSYLEHFMLLSQSMNILLATSISEHDLRKCDIMLRQFCMQVADLYGKRYETFNMHCILHLTTKVRDLGPLWAHSCFFYESLNGDLRTFFHGTQHVEDQIVFSVCIQQKVPEMVQVLQPGSGAEILYGKMMNRHRLSCNMLPVNKDCFALGGMTSCVPSADIQSLIERPHGEMESYHQYFRSKVGQYVIHSEEYSRVTRRNSYTIKYANGFGKIRYYLRCCSCFKKETFIAVIEKLHPVNVLLSNHPFANSYPQLQVAVNHETAIALLTDIQHMCIYAKMPTENHGYICICPNVIESD